MTEMVIMIALATILATGMAMRIVTMKIEVVIKKNAAANIATAIMILLLMMTVPTIENPEANAGSILILIFKNQIKGHPSPFI